MQSVLALNIDNKIVIKLIQLQFNYYKSNTDLNQHLIKGWLYYSRLEETLIKKMFGGSLLI